jgi:hypothetical protein
VHGQDFSATHKNWGWQRRGGRLCSRCPKKDERWMLAAVNQVNALRELSHQMRWTSREGAPSQGLDVWLWCSVAAWCKGTMTTIRLVTANNVALKEHVQVCQSREDAPRDTCGSSVTQCWGPELRPLPVDDGRQSGRCSVCEKQLHPMPRGRIKRRLRVMGPGHSHTLAAVRKFAACARGSRSTPVFGV